MKSRNTACTMVWLILIVQLPNIADAQSAELLTVALDEIWINEDMVYQEVDESEDKSPLDPAPYLYIFDDLTGVYVVSTEPFPGSEKRGFFVDRSLVFEIGGYFIEVKSFTPFTTSRWEFAYVKLHAKEASSRQRDRRRVWCAMIDSHTHYEEIEQIKKEIMEKNDM